jgi:hypothetical protein
MPPQLYLYSEDLPELSTVGHVLFSGCDRQLARLVDLTFLFGTPAICNLGRATSIQICFFLLAVVGFSAYRWLLPNDRFLRRWFLDDQWFIGHPNQPSTERPSSRSLGYQLFRTYLRSFRAFEKVHRKFDHRKSSLN